VRPTRSKLAIVAAGIALFCGSSGYAQDRKPAEITRPAGIAPFAGTTAEFVTLGAKLFLDESLSTNKMSCNSCHAGMEAYAESFKSAYPHRMGMAAEMFGVEKIEAEQAVQLCMLVPMEAKALDWTSRELAALTAYVLKVQKDFAAKK